MLWSMRFHIKCVRLNSCDVIIVFNLHFETTRASQLVRTHFRLTRYLEFESRIDIFKKY